MLQDREAAVVAVGRRRRWWQGRLRGIAIEAEFESEGGRAD